MNNIIERTWRQGGMVFPEDMRGTAFTAEDGAHTFIISGVDLNGDPINLSGTVAASLIRPDGTTTPMTGTISGGKASVTLSAECYGVGGRASLTIFLTSGGQKTAIFGARISIDRSSTSQASPGVAADVVDLVNRIDAAVATIPASYTALMAAIAPDYSSSSTYPKVGSFVWYSGTLYRSRVPIETAESWTAAHWKAAALGNDLNDDITSLKSAIDNKADKSTLEDYAETGELRTLLADSNTLDKNYFWTGNTGEVLTKSSYNAESVYTASPIDVSEYDYVLVQLSSANMSGGRRIGFCNAENIISTVWRESGFVTTYNDKTGMYEKLLAPLGQTHFFFSYSKTVATNIKIYGIKTYYSGDGTVYVSPSGSDSNTGTENSPLKTINSALEKGAKTVLLTGGTYLQTIDLSKSKYASLTMKPLNGSNTVVFKDADCVIGNSANSVSGYTRVKSITTQKTLASGNRWIWQEGINDPKSLISDAWRHPLQRGQEYRRTDTRIFRSSLTTLSDALTDIETSASNGTYKWYYDSGVLYFASPSEVTSEHPICYSNGNRLFNNTPNGFTLNVTGVASKYLIFDVSNTENTTLTDCKSENVYGAGAFIYNDCISVKFIKCEANSCVTGENGDGFNGHANINNSPFTKQCTALFVDCWAHDNNDDGYSDHERAETTIIGGLFESNNKGGVVPSYGSHLTCYNVTARGNYSGFLCAGTAEQAEGGKYTQMLCYNCLAYNNERGGRKSGFCVDGENNKMTLIGCKSIHNTYGYTAYSSSSIAELIDCSASENTASVTNGSGTFDIKNTTAVTM